MQSFKEVASEMDFAIQPRFLTVKVRYGCEE